MILKQMANRELLHYIKKTFVEKSSILCTLQLFY